MEIVFIAMIIGCLPGFIGQSKGRSFFGWWLFGALMFPIALIASIAVRRLDDEPKLSTHRLGGLHPAPTATAQPVQPAAPSAPPPAQQAFVAADGVHNGIPYVVGSYGAVTTIEAPPRYFSSLEDMRARMDIESSVKDEQGRDPASSRLTFSTGPRRASALHAAPEPIAVYVPPPERDSRWLPLISLGALLALVAVGVALNRPVPSATPARPATSATSSSASNSFVFALENYVAIRSFRDDGRVLTVDLSDVVQVSDAIAYICVAARLAGRRGMVVEAGRSGRHACAS